MKPDWRLPVLTEVLDAAPLVEPPQAEPQAPQAEPQAPQAETRPQPVASVVPAEPAGPVGEQAPDIPGQGSRAANSEMARAVLELELEQALRELLEPRLALLLRETARDMAQRLGPRMREWLDDGSGQA